MDLLDHARESIADALKTPSDFSYFGDLPIGTTWTLGPAIETRDSDTLERSNAAAIMATFEALPLPDACKAATCAHDWLWECKGWEVTHAKHWACGHVSHLSYRVIDEHGDPTPQHLAMTELQIAMADYPVLDDVAYSQRQAEEQLEQVRQDCSRLTVDNPPDGWADSVLSWLEEHNPGSVERIGRPGGGGPSDSEYKQALKELGLLDPDEDDESEEE